MLKCQDSLVQGDPVGEEVTGEGEAAFEAAAACVCLTRECLLRLLSVVNSLPQPLMEQT